MEFQLFPRIECESSLATNQFQIVIIKDKKKHANSVPDVLQSLNVRFVRLGPVFGAEQTDYLYLL